MPQFPYALQKRLVRGTVQRQVRQIRDGISRSPGGHLPSDNVPAPYRDNFEINELGRHQSFIPQAGPGSLATGAIIA
ncbi:hypothetical protein MYIN104542_11650 [Mycobacterium intermedium]